MEISNKLPKISSADSLLKERIKSDNTMSKKLKSALLHKDIILGDNLVAINVRSFSNRGIWDKVQTINLTRLASQITPRISFYGWNGLAIDLGLLYGSTKCLDKFQSILSFVLNHAKAYREELNLDGSVTIVDFPKELAPLRADNLFCKDETGESCYVRMWSYVKGTYYLYDDLLQDLLAFGYTKEQLRPIIHANEITNTIAGIPEYIKNKYFINPNGSKAVRDMIKGISNAG